MAAASEEEKVVVSGCLNRDLERGKLMSGKLVLEGLVEIGENKVLEKVDVAIAIEIRIDENENCDI